MVAARHPRAVIVTGGLGAIGFAIATAFAREEGTSILLADTSDDGSRADRLKEIGAADAISVNCNITDEASVESLSATCRERFGAIDVIVNVAGAMLFKPLTEFTAADWRAMLDVNLVGAALFVREGLRHMRGGGAIVNVASVHARRTSALVAPYAAAKAGLVSLTRTAAIEGKPLGIRVNAVLPGAIETPMLRNSPAIRSGAEVIDEADVGRPEDIAAVVRFLCSPEAQFVTGEDMVVDGGRMGRL